MTPPGGSLQQVMAPNSAPSISTFKSCRYCQRRKKKCVLPPAGAPDSRCLACQHLNTTCDIGTRKPSIKRQIRSQRIASSLPRSPTLTSPLVRVRNGDCQLPRAGVCEAEQDSKAIIVDESLKDTTEKLSAIQIYHEVVEKEFPFIPGDYLAGKEDHLPPILSSCIGLAARLTPWNDGPGVTAEEARCLTELINVKDILDVSEAAGLMLLLPRIQPDRVLIDKAFRPLFSILEQSQIPLPIAVGSLTAQTWLTILGHSVPLLKIPSVILQDHGRSLQPGTFAPHYLKLTHLAASTLELKTSSVVETQAWARLEYAALLNVVQMPSEFLDVRDDMPANSAAVITHMLQSTIFLRIYEHLLCQNAELGQRLGLRPVPGVVHFICAITRSIFICPQKIIRHWPILGDVQTTAAQVMLKLWHLTKTENCRALLNLWKPVMGDFEDLHRQIREQIGSGPWDVELIDGYSVFWTFRDLRSLSLEMQMGS